MDIKKELEKLNSTKGFGENIIKDIINEQEELEKKLYLFKVMVLANKLEDAVGKDFFKPEQIASVKIFFEFYDHIYVDTEFYLITESGEKVSESHNKIYYEKPILFFGELFGELGRNKVDFISSDNELKEIKIELKSGIKEKVLEIFLSEELKTILEYNKMELDLPNNNENNSKRMKM